MKDNPLISIILPVYNGEKYLSQSIESCLNQTHKNIELIIVNDCSLDKSLEIINKYAIDDKRIIVINNKENKKLPSSLNIGHQNATGEFLTWTSHDNLFYHQALEMMLESAQNNDVQFVYADFQIINGNGDLHSVVHLPEVENIFFSNVVGACFLYHKDIYRLNKGYNENLFLVEDYDFWLRSLKLTQFYHLPKIVYQYRSHGNSLTNSILSDSDKRHLWLRNLKLMYENIFEGSNIDFVFDYHVNNKVSYKKFVAKKEYHYKMIINQGFKNLNIDNLKKVFIEVENQIFLKDGTLNFVDKFKYVIFNWSFNSTKTKKKIIKRIINK